MVADWSQARPEKNGILAYWLGEEGAMSDPQQLWHDGSRPGPTIAVSLQDIEPATFERCALIRDWLDDHGIDRVTLLVIPARDLHPLSSRSPEMVRWLDERRRAGDTIAQHGFQHRQLRRGGAAGNLVSLIRRPSREAEFVGLDESETRQAVEAGWRLLKLAGLEPTGFVAPAYAYTPALHAVLADRFRWWAGLLQLHLDAAGPGTGRRHAMAPPCSLSSAGPLRRALSPSLVRAAGMLSGRTLRLDLHPADVQHTRHMLAVERVLGRNAGRRVAITYDDLVDDDPVDEPAAVDESAPAISRSRGRAA
jgi:predicted deacetylase